jgi:hypothetical protein
VLPVKYELDFYIADVMFRGSSLFSKRLRCTVIQDLNFYGAGKISE